MTAARCHALVTSSCHRWARVRVRGLRGNESLAQRLVTAGLDATACSTGGVRVPLTAERNQAYWEARLSAQVQAHTSATDVDARRAACARDAT